MIRDRAKFDSIMSKDHNREKRLVLAHDAIANLLEILALLKVINSDIYEGVWKQNWYHMIANNIKGY